MYGITDIFFYHCVCCFLHFQRWKNLYSQLHNYIWSILLKILHLNWYLFFISQLMFQSSDYLLFYSAFFPVEILLGWSSYQDKLSSGILIFNHETILIQSSFLAALHLKNVIAFFIIIEYDKNLNLNSTTPLKNCENALNFLLSQFYDF